MLVVTCKRGERIRIGDYIQVQVLQIEPNQIRIGIEAPKTVEVHRQKVYELIQAEKACEGNGDETCGDPLPGSPMAARIAEMKKAWREQTRITRRLEKRKRKPRTQATAQVEEEKADGTS